MRFFKRNQQNASQTPCARSTCCTDNPGNETTTACFNIGACGCKVVAHPAHQTPAFVVNTPS